MQCPHCRALCGDDDHRCRRCGRRLGDSGSGSPGRPSPANVPVVTATAPAYLEQLAPETDAPPAEEEHPKHPTVVYQRPLFNEMPRVMPARELVRPAQPRARRATRPPARRISRDQQELEFIDSTAPRTLSTSVESVIYCDARAADPKRRAIAATLDALVVAAAMGLFLACFRVGGGDFGLDKHTVPLYLGIAAVLWLFYHLLFCIAGGETPGMSWMELRLINFDGHRPDREQRVHRLLSHCLSVGAAFLGVLWALFDEEHLTWHDHISKTFPTNGKR